MICVSYTRAMSCILMEETPSDIKGRYVQIGILERGKTGTRSWLQAMRCWIGNRIAYNNPLSS